MKRLSIALASLASAMMCGTANSKTANNETSSITTVKGWNVMVDHTVGEGCFITTQYEQGTVLRVGINPTDPDSGGYMMLGDMRWKSLELGKDYKLSLQFDDETPWEAPATAIRMGSILMLHVKFGQVAFLKEFMAKQAFAVSWEGRNIARLRLTGSGEAGLALIRCQQAVNELKAPAKDDPFEVKAKPASDDPFAL